MYINSEMVYIMETHNNLTEDQRKGWQAILDNFKKYIEHTEILK